MTHNNFTEALNKGLPEVCNRRTFNANLHIMPGRKCSRARGLWLLRVL